MRPHVTVTVAVLVKPSVLLVHSFPFFFLSFALLFRREQKLPSYVGLAQRAALDDPDRSSASVATLP